MSSLVLEWTGPPCLFGSKAEGIAEDGCSEVCELKTWHLEYGEFNAAMVVSG